MRILDTLAEIARAWPQSASESYAVNNADAALVHSRRGLDSSDAEWRHRPRCSS